MSTPTPSLPRNQAIRTVQRRTLAWYRKHGRQLPWRGEQDPYRIVISEIMLQQTQVARVLPKYLSFLEQFPRLDALASARTGDVIRAWQGLGYNRRALNLHRTARTILHDRGGRWPQTVKELRDLPGIGRYTAGAVMNFAFHIDTPAVDTNVMQFLDYFFPSQAKRTASLYYELAAAALPTGCADTWLHAVMDYVALQPEIFSPLRRQRATKKKPERFLGSNRYLRGRILDRLRAGPATEQELRALLARTVALAPNRLERTLERLVEEGLADRTNQHLHLPL